MEPNELEVFFITHNGARAVRKAVESLHETAPGVSCTVINNGCHKKHLTLMASLPVPQISYDDNLPLATVWNRAICTAATPFVCISNDDVLFEAGWFKMLSTAMKRGGILQVNMGYPNSSYSCFVIAKELVHKVGWFDPRFKTYCWEDEDWHLRLQEYAKKVGTIFPVVFVRGVRADRNLRKADHEAWGRDFYSTKPNERFFHDKWKRVPADQPGLDPKHHKLKGKIRYVRQMKEKDPYPDVRAGYK